MSAHDPDMEIVSGLRDPWKFLFVDMDIAMLSAGIGFMLLTSGLGPPLALVGGVGFGYAVHVLRKGKPKGYARHLRYWYLPPIMSGLKRVPAAWAHRTVG